MVVGQSIGGLVWFVNSSGIAASRFVRSHAPNGGQAVITQNGTARTNPPANGAAHNTAVDPA